MVMFKFAVCANDLVLIKDTAINANVMITFFMILFLSVFNLLMLVSYRQITDQVPERLKGGFFEENEEISWDNFSRLGNGILNGVRMGMGNGE